MTTEKIQDRIRKLLAMRDGAKTEGEAAAAAHCAAVLMAKYDIAEADLPDVETLTQPHEPIEEEAIDAAKMKVRWQGTLAAAAASSFGARMYYRSGHRLAAGGYGTGYQVVGRRRDIESARYVYQYLVRTVDRLSRDTYECLRLEAEIARRTGQRVPVLPPSRAWKDDFRLGAAQTIWERVKTARRDAVAEAARGSVNPSRALVRVERHEQDVARYMAGLKLTIPRAPAVRNYDGYSQGRAAGNQVSLAGGRAALNAPARQIAR